MGFFQTPFLRALHALVVLFVILQLCSSALMAVTPDGASVTAWYHLLAGMGLCALSLILAIYSLGRHGLKYFFRISGAMWARSARIWPQACAAGWWPP